jgi:hypothetical protein
MSRTHCGSSVCVSRFDRLFAAPSTPPMPFAPLSDVTTTSVLTSRPSRSRHSHSRATFWSMLSTSAA